MKLMNFEIGGRTSFGAADGDRIFDLAARLDGVLDTVALLHPDVRAAAERAIRGADADYDIADVRFRRPVERPGQIVCIGVNYADRDGEYKEPIRGEYPNVFLRTPETLAPHGEALLRPPESEQLDYEGEIAIVIGKGGRRIPQDRALEHIGALTCLNEGCIRDWMRHGRVNITQGKNFYRCGAVGPWMATADEFADIGYDDLRVSCRVNGETRQNDSTANIVFDFRYLIAYASTWNALEPGDIISTGTPIGQGAKFDPPKWLRASDTVEVEVSGVGVLSNPVADEAADAA